MKTPSLVIASITLLASTSVHAIDAEYRRLLERSGCTQVTEAQGCDINKTKAENAKAGFGSAAHSSGPPAAAQQVAHVQFPPGKDQVTVNGAVRGDEYHDYVLRARAGQTLSAHLTIQDTNGDGTVYFNVLPPGSDGEAIFNGSTSANGSARVELPESGDYRLRVYLMGNDRDADKTVGYHISISIR
jgi:hypothetical protein